MNRFMTALVALALLAAPLLLTPSAAEAADWEIDLAHSEVGFKVRHNAISWVKGEFARVEGAISLDPASPEGASAVITIDMASIDTDNIKRDDHLRSADFFEVEKFPTATFTSTDVKLTGTDGSFELIGDLEMKGVSKPVTLKVDAIAGPVQDPWGNTRIGTTATVTIDRKDWGITWNKTLDAGGVIVGDAVRLTLEIELTQKK